MKNVYESKEIRTIGLVGHNTTGKTTLAESLLFTMAELTRMGKIIDGNTASDYHENEIHRHCSIYSSLLIGEFKEKKINILDIPGFSDFVGAIKNALRVSDIAVNVMNALHGIDFGNETLLEYAEQYTIPTLFVFNMMDRENINFDKILAEIIDTVGTKVVPLQIPVKPGLGFNAIIDLIKNKLLRFSTDGKGEYKEEAIPADLEDQTAKLRQSFIEKIAESDDALLEKFFEDKMTEDDLIHGLTKAITQRQIYPLFCTAADTNVGPRRLLEFIVTYIPPAIESGQKLPAKTEKGDACELSFSTTDPVVLSVFKTSMEQAGEMSYFKVISGTLKAGEDLVNSDNGNTERFSQLYLMNGKNRLKTGELHAGDLGAVPHLKYTRTGQTLCHPKRKLALKPLEYPFPSYEIALVPKNRGDEEKMSLALSTLHLQDPSIIYEQNAELKQVCLSGQGELHIRTSIERMKHQFKVEIDMVKPRVTYRETIRNKAESKYRHKKQSGGAGQFAEVWLRISPKEHGQGVEFIQSLVGQNVNRSFVPSVEKGCFLAIESGVISGHRIVDILIDFYDGKEHPVDSKDIAFQTAGKNAFIDAFKQA
ncbi:MAG: elongation factor G, partial [Planctomycetota bacterium]